MKTRTVPLVIAIAISFTLPACTPTLTPTRTSTPSPTLTLASTSTLTETPTVPSGPGLYVNLVDGLASDFIMGADVSMLKQIEISGGKYYANGVEEDCLAILRDHGVNWIRLRIWNDPTDASGDYLGGGNNDLERTVEIARRAKSLDLKFLLDFHYSDWWADPGKQNMPQAWESLSPEELGQAVYNYTAKVIQTLAEAGAMPDMVQIGNEVNGGMLWPAGKIRGAKTGGYDGFAALLKQGIQAVRDNDPNRDDLRERVRIIIHLAEGGNNALFRSVFDALTERNVDFDVIGLSYYSYWHGPLDQFINNMNDISQRYQKDVVVLETAYAYTLEDADGHGNLFGASEQDKGGYKATVQGQATAIRDVIAAVAQVPNGRGLGIFYWEPDWISVEGAGWKAGEGNAWENQAMFDFEGHALPSMDVFRRARLEYGQALAPVTIAEVSATDIEISLGKTPQLPTSVKVVYNDDSIRKVAVVWDAVDPALLEKAGNFTLNGTVEGTDLKAIASITIGGEKNYIENSGFEKGDFAPWVVTGSVDAADISNEAQNVREGDYALHYWLEGAFEFAISQTITGLDDGTYTLSVWIQGGGGEKSLQLYASDCGGDTRVVDIHNTGWLAWQNPTIENIVVTGGECTIGLKVVSSGGSWAFIDEVGLFQDQ
jgi:arabinogalactan endo-1,4-beta-galactosidase